MTNRKSWRKRLTSPRAMLGAVLAVAIAAALLPPASIAPVRQAWETALRPAQSGVQRAVDFAQARVDWCRGAIASADRLSAAESEAARLAEQARQLEAELELVRGRPLSVPSGDLAADSSAGSSSGSAGDSSAGSATDPLLQADAISARVLGRQAQSYLKSRDLLDAGSLAGVFKGALVLDDNAEGASKPADAAGNHADAKSALVRRPVIDAGADFGLAADGLVLAGRRVWGKIAAVGPYTSVVRRACEPGYRDAVQLGHIDGRRLQLGPRGLLVGTGEALCRVEMVDVSQPVAIGDEVYTSDDGVPHAPLLYGRVVRLERSAGQPHWQIWMEPAVGTDEPRSVAVLQMDLNPARVAKATPASAKAQVPTLR